MTEDEMAKRIRRLEACFEALFIELSVRQDTAADMKSLAARNGYIYSLMGGEPAP